MSGESNFVMRCLLGPCHNFVADGFTTPTKKPQATGGFEFTSKYGTSEGSSFHVAVSTQTSKNQIRAISDSGSN